MSSDEAPDTSYYQWVTFMFCIQVTTIFSASVSNYFLIMYLKYFLTIIVSQAALFYLPYKIWTALEGGVLASFGTEGEKSNFSLSS